MDGSMARPFFVSFRVKWRWGPVDREPLLPVIPMGCAGIDVTLGTRKVRLFFCRRTKAEK